MAQQTSEHLFVSWSAQGGLKQVVIDRAEGSWLYSGQRRILDFSSGLVNVNLGHGHPKVVRAIQEQAERLCYVTPGFGEEQRAELARLLAEVTPGDLTKTLFTTGGTEANEYGASAQAALAHVEEVLWYEGPQYVAAILLEPIVGYAGLIIPPDGFFKGLRELCDKYGILLIADEVMTGFGRTGKWFAVDHENVVPDMMTFAKGVNSGYVPLGGVIVNAKIAKHFDTNVLWAGLTYAGHPLACAAGVATVNAYRDEGIIERGARMGELLLRELKSLAARHPSVGDVRGRGLFAGIELVKDRGTKEMLEAWNRPAAKLQTAIKNALMSRDVYTLNRWNMIFAAPPLTVTEDELRFGIKAIDEALDVADRFAATGQLPA
ncbi:MAG: aminotransferase class III-fold pyridoxal phosphate-dependent enzyme [Chloroflexi bacterium]|nr:MAG: aminotransferase class III-fold pyridoxal phosphate-dependent enzyme [Chloroflexota bacterium]